MDLKKRGFGVIGLLSILLAACSVQLATESPTESVPNESPPTDEMDRGGMTGMDGMPSAGETTEYAPLVRGIYQGEEVLFIHTEASDPEVADLLTTMMGPQVVLVPALSDIPDNLLGSVYVFTNGLAGNGPFGFQLDIFDSVPDDDAYRPLRSINLVTWVDEAAVRELQSVEEVRGAEAGGEVMIDVPGIVVNMPILAWSGEQR